ncbi:Crp/Fnr family transcriptional regulator [Paenibacillus urinalis]|uniref:Crp/Fnr family transcriptional regulator n=1 Tax=Paenibacillus urinalis TaxID=521520 RepID=A0AAX3N2W7_9BACL|nr:Crp/Fnr family transcriptional regulator [Paenibacillus urinalis]WDH82957.1 Crp/Fnr family transcriptional regulator [Paenibacillus urinalis]
MTIVLNQRRREATVSGIGGTDIQGEALLKDALLSIMQPKTITAGEILYYEGDDVEAIYYVKSGRIKMTKMSEDGKQIILSFMHAGDLLGEFGGVDGEVYGQGAEVVESGVVGVIMMNDLEKLLSENGNIALEFIRWMGTMQRITQLKLRDLLMNGKAGALASMLVRASNSYGKATPEGILIMKKLNHADLAEMIGATRENVTKTLSGWKDQGIIEVTQGKILIRELKELHGICGCPSNHTCSSKICRL